MIVGLTGGIGSGKSTVAKMFEALAVPVYNSDKEAKQLMNISKNIQKAVVNLLGENAYNGNELNRSYIANQVFSNQELLAKLNAIVHPKVKEHFKDWCSKQQHHYVVQETALIFENNAQDNYDKIILVTAPVAVRVERVTKRDNSSKVDVSLRIDNQLIDAEKIKLADFVIENIDLEKTSQDVMNIHKKLLKN